MTNAGKRRVRTTVGSGPVLAAALALAALGCSDRQQVSSRSGSERIAQLEEAVIDQRLNLSGNEPSIAEDPTNPRNLAVAQFTTVSFSTDGGATFPNTVTAPTPPGYNFGFGGDPSLAFDSQGNLFFSYLATSNTFGTVDVFIQRFDHATATPVGGPVNVSEMAGVGAVDGSNSDKEWLAIDRFPGSPFQDRLYMVWTDFGVSPVAVYTSFSSDSGLTWSPAQTISIAAEGFPWPPHIAAAPNGDVYVAYHAEPSGEIVVLRSPFDSPTSSGGVFDLSTRISAFPPGAANITFNVQGGGRELDRNRSWTQGSAQPFILPDPTDPNHVMIVAADDPTDFDDGAGFDDMAVFAVHTMDRGASWSTPAEVDDGPDFVPVTSHEFFPTGAFDLDSRCVSIAYYASTSLTNDNGDFLLEMRVRTSADGGFTFSPSAPASDRFFDPDLNAPDRFPPSQTFRIGEYNGVLMSRGVVWTGNDPDDDPQFANQQIIFDYSDVQPPVFTSVPDDISVITCDPSNIDLGGFATAEDECGVPPITVTNDAPATFPFGGLVVRWFAEDGAGNVREAPQFVEVTPGENGDTTITFTSVPADIVTSDCTGVNLGTPTAVDFCGNELTTFFNDAPETFPVGTTVVTWTAFGPNNISATATQSVTCTEETPPECNTATLEAEDMDHAVGGPAPEGWNIWSNGDISTTHDFTAGPTSVTIRARGEPAQGIFPHMIVRVDGAPIGDVTVNTTAFADYEFSFVAPGGPQLLSIAFDNDFFNPPEDRNLIVDSATIDCLAVELVGQLPLFTDWGAGYCMGIWLTNEGTVPTSSWQAVIDMQGTEIQNLWNANFTSTTGQVTLTPLSWNSVINPGETNQSIGFCATRPAGGNALATLVSVTAQ